jgi:cathepsin B
MMRAIVLLAVLGVAFVAAKSTLHHKPAVDYELIRKVNSNPNNKWVAGPNRRFFKATLAQAKQLCGVKKNGFALPVVVRQNTTALPTSFDSRTQWGSMCPSTKEIRDQSACGSCWAFGAVEAMTDRICIASQGKVTTHLSADDMTACCTDCGDGCNGGDPGSAWNFWTTTGVVDGGNYGGGGCDPYSLAPCEHHVNGTHYPHCPTNEYPTPQCQTSCQNSETWTAATNTGSSAYQVNDDQNSIMTEIMTYGPVEAAFTVFADFLAYKSGVYHYTSGDELGGHAIKILGWGVWTDSTPYWIVANSWNQDWGNNGYFLIRRGTDECGIEDDVVAGLPASN